MATAEVTTGGSDADKGPTQWTAVVLKGAERFVEIVEARHPDEVVGTIMSRMHCEDPEQFWATHSITSIRRG